ncbi:MAG: hypothetical protein NTZ35_18565 [Ignavibacteriales bacterium]|nr:hypothetical protein [Ignavibacteriales bacterium]
MKFLNILSGFLTPIIGLTTISILVLQSFLLKIQGNGVLVTEDAIFDQIRQHVLFPLVSGLFYPLCFVADVLTLTSNEVW